MNITVAMPTPFQTSTSATEKSARCGIAQPVRPGDPDSAEGCVDKPYGRLHERGERDADGDGTGQHRKEDDASEKPLEPDI